MKQRIRKMFQGPVVHEVKATPIKGKGYGVRVLVNGEVNQEQLAPTRADIGKTAQDMLRMEDKCGNFSDYASRARHRPGEKKARGAAVAS